MFDLNDLWDDMASLEVTLMKGFAFDFTLQELNHTQWC